MISVREIESIQDDRTPPRYLVIGSVGYGGVESVHWIEGELPNIVDYDLIIVDVPALTLEKLKSVDVQRLKRIKTQLVRFLHSGGKLIVITNPIISHKRPKGYPVTLSNYDWCPISILTPSEQGRSIITKLQDFNNYLSLLTKWDYYLFIQRDSVTDELTEFYGSPFTTKYTILCTPIIENRYGRVLAGRYCIEVRLQQTKSTGGYSSHTYTEYPKEPDYKTGDIFLLPLIQGLENRKAVSLILEEVTGISQQTLAPEWADLVIIPGIPALTDQIIDEGKKLLAIETAIQKANEKINNLNEYKRLLYSDGPELEDIVQRCFNEIGGKIIPAKYSQEEFILFYSGNEYLVEVKGSSKSIALKHLRQLNDYLLKYQEDTGKVCKGILFGNAWRLIPPHERNTPDTPIFPKNLIQRAEQWNVALVSSIDFFNSFMNFLEHNDGESLLIAIISQKGIVNFI
jgi:hypothetical protein